ncbi:DUF1853 family protein [Psychroserpens sp. MEBiC05023]
MNLSPKHLQTLYLAYCQTALLWKNASVLNFEQLEVPSDYSLIFHRKLEKRLRLGQLAEQFVFNQIDTCDAIEIFAENIQIRKEKLTLGELDVLIMLNDVPIHLEIIYKFYLYDNTRGHTEIERWIGPNQKDSLQEKLNKLQKKQLPLLYSEACKSALKQLDLDHISFEQRVLFKAQLFVPYQQNICFELLNSDCICGFYITIAQLSKFKDYKFYIPEKLDWFLEPEDDVIWIDQLTFKDRATLLLDNKQSPLFWLKCNNSKLSKCFLVWW